MSDFSLAAEPRVSGRKSAAKAVRLQGRVPGIIYGGSSAPQAVSFDAKELARLWNTGTFQSHALTVELDGKKLRAIPRDVQLHPVRDTLVHVDLLRLEAGGRLALDIPVHFINHADSPGLKRGGVLNIVRHEIELNCPADAIPEAITIDLTGMDINDSVHINSVQLPEGVKPVIQRNFTIVTVAAPSAVVSEAAEAAATAAAAGPAGPAAAAAPEAAPAAEAPKKG